MLLLTRSTNDAADMPKTEHILCILIFQRKLIKKKKKLKIL